MPVDKNVGLGIKFEASFGNLDAVLREMQAKINDLNSKLKSLTDTGSKNADKLGNSYNGVLDKIKRISESVKQAEGSFQKSLKSTNDAFNLEQYLTKKSKEIYKDLYQTREASIAKLEKIQNYVAQRVAKGSMDEVEAANRVTRAQTKVAEATANIGKALDTLKFKKDTPKAIASGFEEAAKELKISSNAVRRAYDVFDEGYKQIYQNIKSAAIAEKSAKDASIKSIKEQIVANKELIADKTKTLAQNREIASEYLKSLGIQNKAIKEAGVLEQTSKEATMKVARELAATQLATSKTVVTSLKEETKAIQVNNQEKVKQAHANEEINNINKKATETHGKLTKALQEQVQSTKINNAVVPELVKNLNKAAGETDAYKTALIQLAKESGNSTIRFQDLASNLKAVEKGLQATGKAGAEVRQQFGYNGIPKDFANTVTAAERVAMTYDRVNGVLSKTNGVLTSTKQGYYQLNNDLKNIRTTYGEVAWATAEVDKKLGTEIRTLGDLDKALKSTQGSIKSQSVVWNEAGKAIDYAAARMNESNKVTKEGVKVGDAWKSSVSQQAVATSFLKGEIANANGTFLQFGKTSLQTSSQIEKLNIQANKLGEQGKALSESFGTSGGVKSLNSYGNAIKDLSTYQNNLAKSTNELVKFQEKATKSYGASQEVLDAYSSRIQKGTMTISQANSELKEQKRVMDDSKNAITNLGNNLEFLNQHFKNLLTSDTNYGAQARKTLAMMEENSKTVKGSAQAYRMTKDALQELDAQLKYAEAGLTNYHESIKKVGSSNEQIAGKIKELNQQIANGAITHREAAVQLKEFSKGIDTIGTSSKNIGNFWAGFVNKIQGGGQAAQVAAGYFTNLGRSVATLGAWMPAAVIIGGVMNALYGAVTAVTDFDQSLKSLQAISQGTNAEIGLLGKEILKISTETKYSAKQIADGAIFIAQAGFSAQESLQVIGAAARGAQGTLESLSIASDLLTSVIRAFHKPASEASEIMDMLAVAANASKTNLEGMKIVFNYLGPAAYAAGLSINETLGAVMALSNAGMRMSTVGTSLRQLFIIMEKPTGALTKMLEQQGKSIKDISFEGKGLLPVLDNLAAVIQGDLGNAVKATNVRTASAVLLLTTMRKHVGDMIKYTTEWGASAEMASKQSESLNITWSRMINKFNALTISFSQSGLTTLVKGLVSSFGVLIDVLDKLVNNTFVQFIAVAGGVYLALDMVVVGLTALGNVLKTKIFDYGAEGLVLFTQKLNSYMSAINLTTVATAGYMSALRGLNFDIKLAAGTADTLVASEEAVAAARLVEMEAATNLAKASKEVRAAKEAELAANWESIQGSKAYSAAKIEESVTMGSVNKLQKNLVLLREAETLAQAQQTIATEALNAAEIELSAATVAHNLVIQKATAGSVMYIASEKQLALAKENYVKASKNAVIANVNYATSMEAVTSGESQLTAATIAHDAALKKLRMEIEKNVAAQTTQEAISKRTVAAKTAETAANAILAASNKAVTEATEALAIQQIIVAGRSKIVAVAVAAGTVVMNIAAAAARGLAAAFTYLVAHPVVGVITALSLLAARIYYVITSMEKESIAIQEMALRFSSNRDEANKFAERLRALEKDTRSSGEKLNDYNAILGQIVKRFPELATPMKKFEKDLQGQAKALEDFSEAQNVKAMENATLALNNLGNQYVSNTYQLNAYNKVLEESGSFHLYALKALAAAIPYYAMLTIGMKGNAYALALNAERQAQWAAAFEGSMVAVQNAVSNGALSKSADMLRIYDEACSMAMTANANLRESFIESIKMPAGLSVDQVTEFKTNLKALVKARQEAIAHLVAQNDPLTEAQKKVLNIITEKLGPTWEKYYMEQTAAGRQFVEGMAQQAIKAGEAAKKAAADAGKNATEQWDAQRLAYEQTLEQAKDKQAKYFEEELKLVAKSTDDKLKVRKEGFDAENDMLDKALEFRKIMAKKEAGSEEAAEREIQALEKQRFLEKLNDIEDFYGEQEKLIQESFEIKKKYIEETKLLEEDSDQKKAVFQANEKQRSDEKIQLYKDQLTAFKGMASSEISEMNKLQQAITTANGKIKKSQEDLNKVYADAKKMQKDVNKLGMNDQEKMMVDINTMNELMTEGGIEAYRGNTEAAKDYFNEAKGMINSLEVQRKDVFGKESIDIEATKKLRSDAISDYITGMESVERIVQERATAERAKAEEEFSIRKQEFQTLTDKVKELNDMLTKEIKFNVSVSDALVQLKKITDIVGEKHKLLIDFVGKGSSELPISEKVAEIKILLNDLKTYFSDSGEGLKLVISFLGTSVIGMTEPISTTIDSLRLLLNKLSTDLTASVTNFLIQIVSKDGGDQGFINVVEARVRTLLDKLKEYLNKLEVIYLVQFKGNDGSGSNWINTIISNVTSKFAALTDTLSKGATYTITTKNVTEGSSGGSGGGSGGSNSGSGFILQAEGGTVPGEGNTDSVPAMLTPGEFVVRKQAVGALGEGFFHAINSMKNFAMPKFNMQAVQAFAGGGPVKSVDHGSFTLNLTAGNAKLPLTVIGNPNTMRMQIKKFEKELSRMKLSRA